MPSPSVFVMDKPFRTRPSRKYKSALWRIISEKDIPGIEISTGFSKPAIVLSRILIEASC